MGNFFQEIEEPVLLYGRDFTIGELEEIIEIIELFPSLSRQQLAKTICENLDWQSPNGSYKLTSCDKLMLKLESEGLVTLPEKQNTNTGGKQKPIVLGPETEPPSSELGGTVSDYYPIKLEAVRDKPLRDLWNQYIERYHVLGYKRPFGARQRYFIRAGDKDREHPLGCLLFSAAAWALSSRDEWIGWEEDDRSRRLSGIINNSRFLIFPWVRVKNLASKVLSLAAKQVPEDWQQRYCYRPVLMETFVDVDSYRGTCYQAANWIYLGQTKGRGRMDRYCEYLSSPKHIYVYPLVSDFRDYLLGNRPDWEVE